MLANERDNDATMSATPLRSVAYAFLRDSLRIPVYFLLFFFLPIWVYLSECDDEGEMVGVGVVLARSFATSHFIARSGLQS